MYVRRGGWKKQVACMAAAVETAQRWKIAQLFVQLLSFPVERIFSLRNDRSSSEILISGAHTLLDGAFLPLWQTPSLGGWNSYARPSASLLVVSSRGNSADNSQVFRRSSNRFWFRKLKHPGDLRALVCPRRWSRSFSFFTATETINVKRLIRSFESLCQMSRAGSVGE